MKTKLIKSVVFLSLTLMLFISTLYAWYISNTTVDANNITGSIIEAEGVALRFLNLLSRIIRILYIHIKI